MWEQRWREDNEEDTCDASVMVARLCDDDAKGGLFPSRREEILEYLGAFSASWGVSCVRELLGEVERGRGAYPYRRLLLKPCIFPSRKEFDDGVARWEDFCGVYYG